MKESQTRKIFITLLAASLFSVACVFPYVLTIQGDLIRSTGIPTGVIFLIQLIQSAVLFSIAIYTGLRLTNTIGFRLPVLEKLFSKSEYLHVLKGIAFPSIVSGIAVAVTIYTLDGVFSYFGTDISSHINIAPLWQKLLASFYGGITEEIIMRLFLMSFFIWIGMKINKTSQPTNIVFWVSNVLAAIVFGLGHLPITASITTLYTMVVVRAIILNGIGGIVFGWLFWKKGFESAVIAHFTTDIFLLSLIPLLLG